MISDSSIETYLVRTLSMSSLVGYPKIYTSSYQNSMTGARPYEPGDPSGLLIASRGSHPYYIRTREDEPSECINIILDNELLLSPFFLGLCEHYISLFDLRKIFGYQWGLTHDRDSKHSAHMISAHAIYERGSPHIELKYRGKTSILPPSWIPDYDLSSAHHTRHALADWIDTARNWALDRLPRG